MQVADKTSLVAWNVLWEEGVDAPGKLRHADPQLLGLTQQLGHALETFCVLLDPQISLTWGRDQQSLSLLPRPRRGLAAIRSILELISSLTYRVASLGAEQSAQLCSVPISHHR